MIGQAQDKQRPADVQQIWAWQLFFKSATSGHIVPEDWAQVCIVCVDVF